MTRWHISSTVLTIWHPVTPTRRGGARLSGTFSQTRSASPNKCYVNVRNGFNGKWLRRPHDELRMDVHL